MTPFGLMEGRSGSRVRVARPADDVHHAHPYLWAHGRGEVKCWGDDEGAQIGNGSTSFTPVIAASAAAGYRGCRGRSIEIGIPPDREVIRAPHGLEALAQVMRYILEVNEHVGPGALEDLLERDLGPEAKDAIMTAGQQLIEQGRQQGIEQGRQQGIEQGIQQGIQQGRQELLLRQLRQRYGGAVNAGVEQRIATSSVEEIETWSVRVL
jgi:hypothetical protein